MSSFDTGWLALREPADMAARNEMPVAKLVTYLGGLTEPSIMDIGCGTGSTYRSLSGRFSAIPRWQLVDYDPRLLTEAERRIGSATVSYKQKDLRDISSLELEGVSLVTASAFFDLCSAAFCDELVECLTGHGIGLYAALNYDGHISWSDPHELDGEIVSAFNRHQGGDKGFGPALGPQAAAHLEGAFARRGYRIETADSTWKLDQSHFRLQEAFLRGMISPVTEVSDLGQPVLEEWLRFRLARLHDGGGLSVGHIDLLALAR